MILREVMASPVPPSGQFGTNSGKNDAKVISTRHGKIKTTFFQCEAGRSFLRFALLLFGLSLPAAVPSVFVTVTTFGSEAEVVCEDFAEMMSITESGRLRKGRSCQPRWSRCQIPSARRTIVSACQQNWHRIGGHRIRNGLLAPIRC